MSSGTLYIFTLPTTCDETGEHLPRLVEHFVERLALEGFKGATIQEGTGYWQAGSKIEREPVQTAQVFHAGEHFGAMDRAARLVCEFVQGYARQREVFALALDSEGTRYVGTGSPAPDTWAEHLRAVRAGTDRTRA